MMDGKTVRTLLAASICVALAACSTKAERIESGLRKGAQYVANFEWDKASVEARNVLQMDAKNAGAYLIAAEVEDGKGSLRNAFANYSKVVELQPSSIDGRLGLARIYLLTGDVDKPQGLIDGVLAAEPQNARAQALQVALMARQGRKDEALAGADRIVRSGRPLAADSSLALAGLYFNAKAFEPALAVLDRAIAADPKDSRLPQMAAEIAQSAPADSPVAARAVDYYSKAAAATPLSDAVWRGWAAMHIRRNELARAETVLRDSLKAEPDDGARQIALLVFLGQYRDKQEAEKEFHVAIDAHPKDMDLRFALAQFLFAQKRIDDAVPVLQAIIDKSRDAPSAVTARGQLAALDLESGKTEQARTLLAEVLRANPRDATGLLLRGRMELADGDARSAVIDLRSAAKDKPGSTEIATLLARAHRMAGDPQLAREALADVVKFNPDNAHAHLLLAADMAQTHEFDSAQPEIDAALKIDPHDGGAWQMKVEMALAARNPEAAQAAARAAQAQLPASPLGHMLSGRVLAHENKPALALAQFDEAARLAPSDPQPLIAAVSLLSAQHQFPAARARIDAIEKANPHSALAREMRGEVALAMGDLPQAATSFGELVEMPGAPAAAYKNLALVMAARKDVNGAIATLQRGEAANPKDLSLPAARAEYLGRTGRVDEAIQVYEQILQRAPGTDVAANNLAYVLIQNKRDKASLDRALTLATRFQASNEPGYVDTLGLVQYRLGRYDQAATLLERARTLAPDDPNVELHYGMALYKKGDVQAGGDLVRKALATKAPLADHDEAQALVGQV